MNVAQVLCAAGPVDAVTRQALAYRRLFESWSWTGEDGAAVVAAGMERGAMRPLRALHPERADVVVFHYSGYASRLERLLRLPQPKLLISHNITPARYFWGYQPIDAVHCTLARPQLGELARGVEAAAGVSEFNAAELRAAGAPDAQVLPILFDRSRLPAPGAPPAGPPTVLFVGRLAPHKRQDLLIRAFALYRRHHAPDARLVLVGVPVTTGFRAELERLGEELAPGAVSIESGVAPERLWEHYRSAHAFVCLSEHEGFCVPLLEAFHFGVPVVARPVGGIPEVAGDATLLTEADNLAVVAELIHLAVTDSELRAELARRADGRLEAYDHARVAGRIHDVIGGLAAAA